MGDLKEEKQEKILLQKKVKRLKKVYVNMSGDFESWLSERLTQFNADGDVFSTYILGILDSEESQEEKNDNLEDLLEGLGLDDGQVDPCQRLQKEIWSKWSNSKETPEEKVVQKSTVKSDLGATLATHAESQTKAFNQSRGHGSSSDDKDREAVKAAILAQYGSSVVEDDASDEDPDDCDDDGNDLMAKNTNSEAVAK